MELDSLPSRPADTDSVPRPGTPHPFLDMVIDDVEYSPGNNFYSHNLAVSRPQFARQLGFFSKATADRRGRVRLLAALRSVLLSPLANLKLTWDRRQAWLRQRRARNAEQRR